MEQRSSLESIDLWLNTVHAFAGRSVPQGTPPLGGHSTTPHKGRRGSGGGADSILPQVFIVGMLTSNQGLDGDARTRLVLNNDSLSEA